MISIGNYTVSSQHETFRIFPKNKRGETIPVTRVNNFLHLRCQRSGTLTTFKRFRHQGRWYWRDSRDTKPCHELHVLAEVARMLFGGSAQPAQALLVRFVCGQALAA